MSVKAKNPPWFIHDGKRAAIEVTSDTTASLVVCGRASRARAGRPIELGEHGAWTIQRTAEEGSGEGRITTMDLIRDA